VADGTSAPTPGELVAGNYQIAGIAGTGGMGVVYRALDLRLQRTVALKFLPSELNASERDKQRFLQEARTASSLDHPNIGVIYGIEETADDRTFIVMAYYEGQSLATRIRSGPMPPSATAEIAIQVLKALDFAHVQGVEHRDVKPSNIMLAQQQLVKLVDFGLAHVSQQTASKTHGVSGTVSYMSPEQTLGRGTDSRTDIWATGVVMLEMLTGQNPFSRETIPATVFSILNEPPEVPDAVTPPLRQIIYRALAKDPVRRYQSCAEMLHDLENVRPELTSSAVVEATPEIASPKRSRESSELRRTRESASATMWAFAPVKKGRWKPWVFTLGGVALLAGALLIPSVRQELAGVVARASASAGNSGKPAADEGYITALGLMQRYDRPGNLDRAIEALQGSIKADPLFALGYAQLGEAYRMKYQAGRDPKWLDLALANCERAQQLDTRLPAAYSTLASIHNEQGKHDLALQEFNQALEINPRDPAAIRGIARSDETAGRFTDAEAGFRKVTAVVPDDWRGYNDLGNFYSRQAKYPQAIDLYKQALDLTPDNAEVYSNLGSTYLDAGDPNLLPLAEQSLKKSLALNPSYPVLTNLAVLSIQQGKYAEAVDYSKQALKLSSKDYVVWDNLRLAYIGLGDSAQANAAISQELALLESGAKDASQDGWAQALMANLYARQGKTEKAEAHIQAALSLGPRNPEVLMELADASVNLHDPARARGYVQKAIDNGADIATLKTDVELGSMNLNFDKDFRKK
jgi:tetratricopeptide (TPR) repeat protein